MKKVLLLSGMMVLVLSQTACSAGDDKVAQAAQPCMAQPLTQDPKLGSGAGASITPGAAGQVPVNPCNALGLSLAAARSTAPAVAPTAGAVSQVPGAPVIASAPFDKSNEVVRAQNAKIQAKLKELNSRPDVYTDKPMELSLQPSGANRSPASVSEPVVSVSDGSGPGDTIK